MATNPSNSPPRNFPFITGEGVTGRTAFCQANELTAPGSNSPSPPQETSEATEKKIAGAKKQTQRKNRAKSLLARKPGWKMLENPVKLRIIELFAHYYTAASIQTQIDLEFGKWLDIKQIAAYDPTKRSSNVGKKLRLLFNDMRAEYIAKSAEMAMAHQAHRLRLIGEVVEKATNARDFGNALKGLELAAKEMGGVLEGKQTVIHSGAVAHVHGTIEDARQEVAMRLAALVDGGLLLPAADVASLPAQVPDIPTQSTPTGTAP